MAHEGAKTGQARSLRKRMTSAERRLWSRLRARRFHGLLWYRQEPFGRFVVDFYCPVARLVVELDGEAHALTAASDQERRSWLEAQGVAVVRVPNWAVMTDLARVLADVYDLCKGHLAASESG